MERGKERERERERCGGAMGVHVGASRLTGSGMRGSGRTTAAASTSCDTMSGGVRSVVGMRVKRRRMVTAASMTMLRGRRGGGADDERHGRAARKAMMMATRARRHGSTENTGRVSCVITDNALQSCRKNVSQNRKLRRCSSSSNSSIGGVQLGDSLAARGAGVRVFCFGKQQQASRLKAVSSLDAIAAAPTAPSPRVPAPEFAAKEEFAGSVVAPAETASSSSSSSLSPPGGNVDNVTTMSAPTSEDELATMKKARDGELLAIMEPVSDDFEIMRNNLLNIVGSRHPMLVAAAEDIFGAGGKRVRPMLSLLVARATLPITHMEDIDDKHRRLAEIMEMIHTASLVHDDVLDECELRRGKPTTVAAYGTRFAVLAGDFLFAQSSWFLANLDNLEVIKLISQVIADFADGEIAQAQKLFDANFTMEDYAMKNFYKTASLIAAGCRGAAVFSDCTDDVKEAMYEYGKHLGLAFQIIDDILDFTTPEHLLGKPAGQDLAQGNLTAPALFALKLTADAHGRSRLKELVESGLKNQGELDEALGIINDCGAYDAARKLARQEGDIALRQLDCLPESESKTSLKRMVGYVLERMY